MHWTRTFTSLALLLATSLSACAATPTIYTSKPIEGRVVDANTGKPIEGAVVMVRWEMWMQGAKLPGDVYSPKIMETLTDAEGHFSFAGWGPEPVCCGAMDWNDPEINILALNYDGIVDKDGSLILSDDPRVRNPNWNGKTFQLEPYPADLDSDGSDNFHRFESFANGARLGFLKQPQERCGWAKVPLFMGLLLKQIRIFQEHNYKDSSIVLDLMINDKEFKENYGCPSPKKYFGGLEK